MSHFKDIVYTVMKDRKEAEGQLTAYSVKEAVLSNLNIHIRNVPGKKRNFHVSVLLNKDASDTIFPDAHKGWELKDKGAHVKKEGVFLNYATYQRPLTALEQEAQEAEYALEEAMEDNGFLQESSD